MIKNPLTRFLCFCFLLFSSDSFAQLAEIKPFDTAKSDNATSDRIFADAVKENMLGNAKEAEALFNKFVTVKPNVAAGYYELARLNAKENNTVKSEQNIRKAISLDSANKWYKELFGNLLATTNRYAEAAEVFSQLANNNKPNEDYLLKASLLYQRAKMYEKSIAVLEQLVDQRGADEDVLMQINQLYLKQNKIEDAAKTLRRLVEANPKEGRYYALLAEMYLNNKNDKKAKEIYDEAEKKFPEDISVQLGYAAYYKSKNDSAKYTEYINKAIGNRTIDEQTQVTLLVSYLQDMGKDSAAISNALLLTETLVKQKPENSSLQGVYGDLLSMNGRPKEAIEAYKKSLKKDSTNLNIWQQFLFNLTDKPNADSLIYYSENALTLFPSAAILYYLNGIGYVNKGNYSKGIKAITTAIDYQPEDNKGLLSEMYASLGDAYNSNKEFALSDKAFEEALKLAPENPTVLNNYAYYLSVRNVRLEDAEKYSAKSLQLRPGEATFLDTYGWIFYQQGKYEKARELIQQAIDKNGKNADATLYEHLGDVYFKLNDVEKAVQNWMKAKEKDPLNEQLERKIKTKKLYE